MWRFSRRLSTWQTRADGASSTATRIFLMMYKSKIIIIRCCRTDTRIHWRRSRWDLWRNEILKKSLVSKARYFHWRMLAFKCPYSSKTIRIRYSKGFQISMKICRMGSAVSMQHWTCWIGWGTVFGGTVFGWAPKPMYRLIAVIQQERNDWDKLEQMVQTQKWQLEDGLQAVI